MPETIEDKRLQKDMEALVNMVKVAEEQGLLIEVLHTFSQMSKNVPIPSRCKSALYEWDC